MSSGTNESYGGKDKSCKFWITGYKIQDGCPAGYCRLMREEEPQQDECPGLGCPLIAKKSELESEG